MDFKVGPQDLPGVLRNVNLHQQGFQRHGFRAALEGNPEVSITVEQNHDQHRDPESTAAGEFLPRRLEQDRLEKHQQQGKPEHAEHIGPLRHDPRIMERHAQRIPAEPGEQPAAQPFQARPHRAEAERDSQVRPEPAVFPRLPPSRGERSEQAPENREIKRQQHRAEPGNGREPVELDQTTHRAAEKSDAEAFPAGAFARDGPKRPQQRNYRHPRRRGK